VRVVRLAMMASLLASLLVVAAPTAGASAGATCEPRMASTYRYDSETLSTLFVLRLCEPVDELTYEIQFDRVDLITQFGFTAFILGVTECQELRCEVTYRYPHGNELARYDITMFWFVADADHIGPLFCATRDSNAGCREPA
jgi:hypothetical protein